jgi:hypothetical protein
MIKYLILIISIIVLIRCNTVSREFLDIKKTWVYVELEVVTNDTDYYYYLGQINQKTLDELEPDQGSSLFVLRNVRYYDDYDEIQEYADEFDDGTLFFRKDDIIKMEILKHDPLYLAKKDTIAIEK